VHCGVDRETKQPVRPRPAAQTLTTPQPRRETLGRDREKRTGRDGEERQVAAKLIRPGVENMLDVDVRAPLPFCCRMQDNAILC
jgi:hypothetical protein